jgi:hypothetical protein
MTATLMACGHVAQGVDKEGNPVCVVCIGLDKRATFTMTIFEDMLRGRTASCSCGKLVASSLDLAFFEFRGEGSRAATEICTCGYSIAAHQESAPKSYDGRTAVEQRGCTGFTARGPWETDLFYCGCRGWD